MNISKWFTKPRLIGSPGTRSTRVLDEVHLLPPEDRAKSNDALEMAVGKEWKRVPTRSMMELVNLRLCTKPRDYAKEEVGQILSLLIELSDCMSPEQRRFLDKFDHLPKAIKGSGPWMDGEELAAYEKADEDAMHQRKTAYFVAARGITQADDQSKGVDVNVLKPERAFKITPVMIGVIVAILIVATLLWL